MNKVIRRARYWINDFLMFGLNLDLVIAVILVYSVSFVCTVGYCQLINVDNVHPILFPLGMLLYVVYLFGTYDAWLDRKESAGRALAMLIGIGAGPVIFTLASHASVIWVADWSMWLKYRFSGMIILAILFEILILLMRQKEQKLIPEDNVTPFPPQAA